jgi:hypothetical protein
MIRGLILVLALVAATSSRANILSRDDAHRALDFYQKLLSLQRNVGEFAEYAPTSSIKECLYDLGSDLVDVLEMISPVDSFVRLEVEMVDPTDERTVIKYLRLDVNNFLVGVGDRRKHVNGIVGQCASSGLVAAKAQEILRLFQEGAALVEVISKKIGTEE